MRILWLILLIQTSLPLLSSEKEQIKVALGFDDTPKSSGYLITGTQRTAKLLNILDKRDLRTVFFCNTTIFPNHNSKERIGDFLDSLFIKYKVIAQ